MNNNPKNTMNAGMWLLLIAATGILMVTMGIRLSLGLFLGPINTSTGLGIVDISFALAVTQLMWGVSQPVAGALADKYGAHYVLYGGTILLVAGFVLAPFLPSTWGLILTLGFLVAFGTGAGSFSVLLGAAQQNLPLNMRGHASGIINAGGSFGQFMFAPLLQKSIAIAGWINSMFMLAVISILTLPLIRLLPKAAPNHLNNKESNSSEKEISLKEAVFTALKDKSYILLHAGFFTCGFHIAFLVTHLPGEIELCGLPPAVAGYTLALIGLSNIIGSLVIGKLVGQYKSKNLLALMYASRAILIVWYLLMPPSEWVFYTFAVGLGFTWLSTVPPTATVCAKLFGVRYLATLFGLTLLSHQIGAFFGAWLGGLAFQNMGNYQIMWFADIALATLAAILNLPIKEPEVKHA